MNTLVFEPEAMQHRLAIPVKLLSVTLFGVFLAGCSVAEYRQMYFPTHQPTSASWKIDAAVAIETTANGFPDGNLAEAFRQVVNEDLSALFSRPLLEQRPDAEFLLRTSLLYEGIFPPSSVEATVTLLQAKTGTKIVSFSRKVQDSTFVGDFRMKNVADKFLRITLSGLKEELVKTFDGARTATRRAPIQPFPGLQADR